MAISFGEVRTKFIADDTEWQPGLGRIASGLDDLQATADGSLGQLKAGLAETATGLDEVGTAAETADGQLGFANALGAGIAALSAVANKLDGVRRAIGEAGGAADDLRDRLAGPFKDTNEEVAKLAEAQLVLGFKPEEIEVALTKMNRLGLEPTQQNLTVLEDISRSTGQSIETLAEKFGRVNEFADPKAVLAFQRELGATSQALVEYGAKIDENNKVLTDTPARAEAARKALLAFAAANFSGAAERVADETARMEGEFELLKREIGAGSVALKESFSPAIRSVIAELRGLPPELKGAVGAGLELTAGLASVGVGALGVATNVAILSTNAQAMALASRAAASGATILNGALAILGGTLGAVLLVVGAAAIGLAAYTAAIEANTKAEEALIALEEKQNRTLKENRDLLNKSAEDLLKLGKSSKDVANLIGGLRNQAEAARAAGNSQKEASILREIQSAEKLKTELAAAEARARDAKVNPPDDVSKKEQAKIDKAAEAERKKADAERLKAEKQSAKEAEVQRRDLLAEELSQVREAAAAKEISVQQQIDGLRRILATVKVTAQERRQIEAEIARLNGQIEQQRVNDHKRAEAEKTRQAKEEADQRARDQKKAEADAAAASRKETAQANSDQKKAESDARAEEDKIAQLKGQTRAAQEKVIDDQVRQLEQEAEKRRVNTTAKIKVLLDQRLALEVAAIESERDLTVKRADSEEVRAAAVESAEARIKAARSASTAKLQAEVERQQKILSDAKKKAADESTTGPFGVAELGKQLGAIFGDQAVKARISEIKADSQAKSGPIVATAAASSPISTAARQSEQLKASDIGAEVAKQLNEKLSIQISVINQDTGERQTQTYTGTRQELAAQRNIFNPANMSGRR